MEKTVGFAFRMVHIDNIPHILRYGIVTRNSVNANPNYTAIGDTAVIAKRNDKMVLGHLLSEYIPFYFGPRSPMLYVIQHGYNNVVQRNAEDIVYCVVRLEDIISSDIRCCFSDGHAMSAVTSFYDKSQLNDIARYVSHQDVFENHWGSTEADSDETKRKKEAELLFLDDIPAQYICSFVVYNETTKENLINLGAKQDIYVAPHYYF